MIEIYFEKTWATAGYNVFAFARTPRGRIPLRIHIESLKEIGEGEEMRPSTHIADRSFFTALIAGLQEAGLLPIPSATEAELKATTRHLADMRSLVFESVPPAKELKC